MFLRATDDDTVHPAHFCHCCYTIIQHAMVAENVFTHTVNVYTNTENQNAILVITCNKSKKVAIHKRERLEHNLDDQRLSKSHNIHQVHCTIQLLAQITSEDKVNTCRRVSYHMSNLFGYP